MSDNRIISQNTIDKYKKMYDTLLDSIDKKREYWNKEIESLIQRTTLKNIDNYDEVQMTINSYRHKLVDYLYSDLKRVLTKINGIYDDYREQVLVKLKTNYDLRLNNEKEFSTIINKELRFINDMIELVTNQIEKVQEDIDTLDKLNYVIKNNKEIYELQLGK